MPSHPCLLCRCVARPTLPRNCMKQLVRASLGLDAESPEMRSLSGFQPIIPRRNGITPREGVTGWVGGRGGNGRRR